MILPVSTPPNAIVHSTGEVTSRDFRPGDVLVALLGPTAIIAWVSIARGLVASAGAGHHDARRSCHAGPASRRMRIGGTVTAETCGVIRRAVAEKAEARGYAISAAL